MNIIDLGNGIMKFDNVIESGMCRLIIDKFDADNRKIKETPSVDEERGIGNYRTSSMIVANKYPDWNMQKAIITEAIRSTFVEYTKRHSCGQNNAVDRGIEVVCYEPGQVCGLHCDGGPNQLRIFCSVIIFLNTVPKGELCFPEQKLQIAPKEGSVVLFPSNFTHPHHTNPSAVKRYVVVNFLAHKEFTP